MNEPEKVSIINSKHKRQIDELPTTAEKLQSILRQIDEMRDEIVGQQNSFDNNNYNLIINGSLQVVGTTSAGNIAVGMMNDVNFNNIYRNPSG